VSFAALAGAAPRFLGVRFDGAGRPLRCSGNTVLAHLGAGPAAEALIEARDRIAAAGGDAVLAFLPPASLHMTLFDGVLHDVRAPARWPRELAPEAGAEEADRFMMAALRAAPRPGRFRLRPLGLGVNEAGMFLHLEGADAAEEARLRRFRDDLARLAGLAHRPDHDRYRFHVTLAYLIAPVPADLAAILEAARMEAERALLARLGELRLGPPEACLFDDMTAFHCQFLLG